MMSKGIRDRVAVVGMGCTGFGEHWDRSAEDLLIDAVGESFSGNPRLDRSAVDAYWLGTLASTQSGLLVSKALGADYTPVTRVENYCASGTESFRNACYAVASGAYDMVVATGVEKLKDSGFSGLLRGDPPGDGTAAELAVTAPAAFSMLDPAYCARYGVDPAAMRAAMTQVAWKNHRNGARNPKAQFRSEVSREKIESAPLVAGRLGVFDCSGVSDGAACAVIVPAEHARDYTDTPMYVKAVSLAGSPGLGAVDPRYDFTTFPEVVRNARDAYAQAGITDPRREISFAEVHDCFTPTELVLMEDLGFSDPGNAWRDSVAGDFDSDGRLPVNIDGGLKSFGHPVGASGLRMLYECWLQLRGAAGRRQLPDPRIAVTHNLGGRPGACVSAMTVVGRTLG
ncbi:acetyl-CoA acetyltransferase [Nocardia seriolae]|uniref:Acetyl-CoA C-acetyltransferase n=2 Tax=Nocardia seriolae TaxID=37332 RepID=A0ABC8AVB4_9NOCA|nr:acetyl-CoA acetyltransferase [Nocardia seriolae]APA98098.1 Acetyl-CoA C-acetyltransferase [Nocardia seriolae]MTJ62792.1 PRK06157 family protein [Nocardia seriolae]MTJ73870.1 PRK06157 family protein [Nocardia seriolae]MTJ87825.1 PRK06157 family protein [Nocardia seriolae]MTK31818.1 PRK06157 family protein [Nocardia seriolae]